MAELTEILSEKYIPNRDGIEDKVDSITAATPLTIAVVDGWVQYMNDGIAYSDGNTSFFNTTTGHLDTSSLPLYSHINIILNTDILATNPNAYLLVKCVIPDTAGEIEGEMLTILPLKNTNYPTHLVFNMYNGLKAKEFGFKIYTSVEVDSIILSNRRIKIIT